MSTVLITGANRGIGLEHVRRYAARGVQVFAAVRDPADAPELSELAASAGSGLRIIRYDARDPGGPEAVRAAIGDAALDLLLNNAGVMGGSDQALDRIDPEAFLDTIRVNTLAPLLLSQALADAVARSQRRIIANQSSLMGSIADNGSGGYYAYRASKAALNMVTKSLARDLAGRGVTVVTLHPGWVRTRMGGPSAPVTTETCVEGQQRVLDEVGLDQSGQFFNYDGRALPW